MGKQTSRRRLCLRLACHNVANNRRVYVPYLVSTAVMAGVFLLIAGLMFSDTLANLPTGETAVLIFGFGLAIFSVFTFCFMAYIDRFLLSRRKREFGLYGVLGLEKRHILRVLMWEKALVMGLGVLLGGVCALVFGRLVFWLLLRIIRAAPGSTFSLAPVAFLLTAGLFTLIFLASAAHSARQVRLSSPVELMQSSRKGEKESPFLWPLAVLGALALATAYYFAWTIDTPATALFVFFALVALVVFATFTLFSSGSAALLKLLRQNKRFYYQPAHFVTVSGLTQRMKQNARSLAAISILSTMLVVTASGTLALYLGQEEMLSGMYPFDMCVYTAGEPSDETVRAFEQTILSLAETRHVTLSADPSGLTNVPPEDMRFARNNYVPDGAHAVPLTTLLYADNAYRFDADGAPEDCIRLADDIRNAYPGAFAERPKLMVSEVFTARQEGYGLYGGLLFLGAFFGLLFLCVTVLLIYFKQITEGFEDRERFVILQQVGMDDAMVRKTINRQVLWIFFLPLGVTALHTAFASRIMARMLQTFMLYDWPLVMRCIGGALAVFALTYLLVFRLTARTYYRIVKR